MLVRMRVAVSGTHNGEPYPPMGVDTEVDDHFGAKLCAKGLATPVTNRGMVDTAVAPPAELRRGPGRPRKEESV